MRYGFFVLILTALVGVSYAQTGGHQFIGAQKCKTCHKKPEQGEQFSKWQASKHANAFEALKSEAAAKIAKERGLNVAAVEAPECLKCHVAGYDADASMFGPKFAREDGVQCESCHGAGADYKKKKIMQDRALSIENGLNPILVEDGTAEKMCRTCHNEESPTFKEFDFQARWKEIAHPIPEG